MRKATTTTCMSASRVEIAKSVDAEVRGGFSYFSSPSKSQGDGGFSFYGLGSSSEEDEDCIVRSYVH